METGSNREAARLHYIHCEECGEYKAHSVTTPGKCSGLCGLMVHDDPNCPLQGKIIMNDAHVHTVECHDC